jgi:hypothetical protein
VSELNPMPCYVLATVAVFHSSRMVRKLVPGKASCDRFLEEKKCQRSVVFVRKMVRRLVKWQWTGFL